jgi:hypothetical protein
MIRKRRTYLARTLLASNLQLLTEVMTTAEAKVWSTKHRATSRMGLSARVTNRGSAGDLEDQLELLNRYLGH